MHKSTAQSRRGFTLVELLVVISIIVVLIAILMPGLQGARRTANSAKCMANLKQYGMAVHYYTQENNGLVYLPYSPNYDARPAYYPFLNTKTTAPSKVTQCPDATTQGMAAPHYGMNSRLGRANFWKYDALAAAAANKNVPAYTFLLWADSSRLNAINDRFQGTVVQVGFRHPGETANMLFLDLHVGTGTNAGMGKTWSFGPWSSQLD